MEIGLTGNKGVSPTEEISFDKYFYTVLTPAVVRFNTICFGDFRDFTNEQKAAAINLQMNIVNEEMVDEYRKYYASDMLEELDAVADSLFVISQLMYQLSVVSELSSDDISAVDALINQDKLELLLLDYGSFMQTFMTHYDLDVIVEATNRVIANNEQKFTSDFKLFRAWMSPEGEGLKPSSKVYEGVEYFCLVNETGKIRKKAGFESVHLQDLVDKQELRYASSELHYTDDATEHGEVNEETK